MAYERHELNAEVLGVALRADLSRWPWVKNSAVPRHCEQRLLDACWAAYDATLNAPGALTFGRCAIEGGNADERRVWAPIIHACWVLGGTHRGTVFELDWKNILDSTDDRLNVIARAAHGLANLGYSQVRYRKDGARVTYFFPPKGNERMDQRSASLTRYHGLMERATRSDSNSMRERREVTTPLKWFFLGR